MKIDELNHDRAKLILEVEEWADLVDERKDNKGKLSWYQMLDWNQEVLEYPESLELLLEMMQENRRK